MSTEPKTIESIEEREAQLAKFDAEFRALLAKQIKRGLEVDDIAEVAEAVLSNEWNPA